MKDESITAWLTVYALSTGIQRVNARMTYCPTMIAYGNQYAHEPDWYRTPEEALARAEAMRKAGIASHKKSLAKLEQMTFKVPE